MKNILFILLATVLVISCKKENSNINFANDDKNYSTDETERIKTVLMEADLSTIVNHNTVKTVDRYRVLSSPIPVEENLSYKFNGTELTCDKNVNNTCTLDKNWEGFNSYFGAKNKFELISNSGNQEFEIYVPQKIILSEPYDNGGVANVSKNTVVKWNKDSKNNAGILVEYETYDGNDIFARNTIEKGNLIIKDDGEFNAGVFFNNSKVKSVTLSLRRGNAVSYNLSSNKKLAFYFVSSKVVDLMLTK